MTDTPSPFTENFRRALLVNPCTVYLQSLVPSGRRSMHSVLRQVTRLLHTYTAPERVAWHALRYHDLVHIRSALGESGRAVNTVNTIVAPLPKPAKTASLGFDSRRPLAPSRGETTSPPVGVSAFNL